MFKKSKKKKKFNDLFMKNVIFGKKYTKMQEEKIKESPFEPLKYMENVDIVDLNDVLIIHIEDLSTIKSVLHYPHKMENYYFIGLCVRGEMVVSLGLQDMHIKALSFFSWMPPNILRLISYDDCEAYVIAFNRTFAEKMNLDFGLIIPILLYVQQHPILHQESTKMQLTSLDNIRTLYENIYNETKSMDNDIFVEKVAQNLMSALIYRLCHEVSKEMVDDDFPRSKEGRYLYDFVKLLTEYCRSERSVEFYAEKLCITPKYLSSRLRKVSGMSAKEWIDNYLILEIKNLLKYSNMDVKEIAFSLNFPNQSFFTQYFKRHTGMLPTEYRRSKE